VAALSNKERVGRVLDLTAEGLGPWMVDLLTRKYGEAWQAQVRAAAGAPPREFTDKVDDPSYLFWVFDKQWASLFRNHVSFEERRCVSSLWDARKEWAHGSKFTDEQAERVLSDGEHLLRHIGAVTQADSVDELRRELRRIRYEKDQKQYQAAAEKRLSVRLDMSGLPAWRDVVEPHNDVAQGTFQLAQFAADLRQVALGIARPEYGDPVQFFDRTYITRGLRYLLSQTLLRLNGVGGEPVIDLMTTFGGGKTHSEIAVYHLAGGTAADSLLGVREICDEIGVADIPTGVNRAVIVGNDFSVLGTEKPDGTTVRTLWGELAYQLGKKEGYARVARYDENSVPPPTSDIADLLGAYAPCVILIDEWVAYLRQLYSHGTDDPYPAGTFDAHQTFAQSLTEAAKSVDTALLVVSLPASDSVRDMGEGIIGNAYEIGGTAGLEALRSLRSVIHRVETPWQPATVEESYEIVRRRIFKPLTAEGSGGRDLVISKFADYYLRNATMLPSEVQQPQYKDVMKAAYPIHPEIFNRLYQDWSTLERFQRTRGVLRLMATVVHALWVRGDQSALIMPASIPLDDTKVFEEITSHLDDSWKPVVDADVAGGGSTADMIDRDIPLLGKSMAGKRAARCVFLGTAPSVSRNARTGDSVPIGGIEQKRVVLGATYPGDNPAHVADALRQLGDRGRYMNRDQDRYWLSLQQTVSRIMQELADGYDVSAVHAELARTIREENDRGVFARVHRVPAGTGDVEDEPTAALVVFGLDRPHSKKATSVAADAAHEFLSRRGGQPRIHKNTLVFVAPDVDRIDTLDSVLRRKMAWESIKKRVKELNLDQHNITVVENRLAQANQAVTDTIRETYRWIIIPYQELGGSKIDLETVIMDGSGSLAERVSKKAESTEFVLKAYAPSLLRQQIDRLQLWSKQPYVQVGTLCGYFTQYLYMPRVRGHDVIHTAIRNLADVLLPEQDSFAYADSQDSDGRYLGLALHNAPSVVSNSGLVVNPIIAQRQIDEETSAAGQDSGTGETTDGSISGETKGAGAGDSAQGGAADRERSAGGATGGGATQARATRFHATKALDPTRSVRDISQISDEIIAPFTASGAQIQITVDIESTAVAKLTLEQVTALKENLNTLGFNEWNVE
jgi:predicted AAA+ superfamily ATPase